MCIADTRHNCAPEIGGLLAHRREISTAFPRYPPYLPSAAANRILTPVPGGVQNVNVTINDIPVGSGYVIWLVEAGTTSEYACTAGGAARRRRWAGWIAGWLGGNMTCLGLPFLPPQPRKSWRFAHSLSHPPPHLLQSSAIIGPPLASLSQAWC
jgi:hypothetical protein